jgi:zona occludens toxin (predicted ATPase)
MLEGELRDMRRRIQYNFRKRKYIGITTTHYTTTHNATSAHKTTNHGTASTNPWRPAA